MNRRTHLQTTGLAAAAFFALSWLAASDALAAENHPYSIPVSPKVIEGTILLPDGQTGMIRVRDGAMITVRDDRTGETFKLVPAISTEDPGMVNVLVLRSFKTKSGDEGVEQVGDVQGLSLGADSDFSSIAGPFGLRFERVGDQLIEDATVGLRSDSLGQVLAQEKVIQESSCCVSCDGYTVCACSVNLLCGSCCASGCCPGDGGRRPIQNY